MPPLPPRVVIFPSKEPRLLTTLVPDRQLCTFQYKVPSYQLGVYTGHAPDTSYVYSLPFEQGTGDALLPCSTSSPAAPGNRYS